MGKIKVLSTKKLLPSLNEQAKQEGIEITEKEFIAIHLIISDEKKVEVQHWGKKNLTAVFTSVNAVNAVKNLCGALSLDICCLSGSTKENILKTFSSSSIVIETENAEELAYRIIRSDIKEVVFFCGDKRRDELVNILLEANIGVNEVMVYKTVEIPSTINEEFDGILFFSPSAVNSFFSLNELNDTTVCFAFGKTTARAIKMYSNNLIISETPRQEAMLTAVQTYFQNLTTKNE